MMVVTDGCDQGMIDLIRKDADKGFDDFLQS
jgi:hypothetical protein